MKAIFGLGNPGSKHDQTRHNAGFMFLDLLSKNKSWQKSKNNDYLYRWGNFGDADQEILLVKPVTFMNKSGEAVRAVQKKHQLSPEDIWVAHDDLDLETGSFKLTLGHGPKVHNGLLSIYQLLGTEMFWHIRIGVDSRQGDRSIPGEKYVMLEFDQSEKTKLNIALEKTRSELLQML